MSIVGFIFGERPRPLELLSEPPKKVRWRYVHPKRDQPPVRARRAEADCQVRTAHGVLHAKGGVDFIISNGVEDDTAVVAGDIFQRIYEPLGDGLYRKRSDVTLRYFTLNRPVVVKTMEGRQKAAAGDWIMQGVVGELWPVPPEKAKAKYDPA